LNCPITRPLIAGGVMQIGNLQLIRREVSVVELRVY
jgi:hypothetical protein